MDQNAVTQLLNRSSEAGEACRDALLDGAQLILWRGSAPADRMLAAYRRRHARAIADGVDTIGFVQALDDLGRAGTSQLSLGQVTVADPAYIYMIFMVNEPPALVACVGIARG
jgi:hypothetical protein